MLAVAETFVDVDAMVVTVETNEVATPKADVVFCVDINVICVYVRVILLLITATWQFIRVEAVDKVFFN